MRKLHKIVPGAMLVLGGLLGQVGELVASEPDHTPPPAVVTEVDVTPHAVPRAGEPAPREFVVPVDWCPQEDSCYADYRPDGTWVIVEGQR